MRTLARRGSRIGVVLLLAAGCAHAPSTFPARSAASPEATAGDAPVIARALTDDPPLPGAATEGWPGLAPSTTDAPDPHAGHHGHHVHGAAPSEPAP